MSGMAPNTSATGGVLLPAASIMPVDDVDIDVLFRNLVQQLTGLPGNAVYRSWQDTPPAQLPPDVNWASVGVTSEEPAIDHVRTHEPDRGGFDVYDLNYRIEVRCVLYGPGCRDNAGRISMGLRVPQNREALVAASIGFVRAGRTVSTNELVNGNRVRRADMVLEFNRVMRRAYQVMNVESPNVRLAAGNEVG